MTKLNSLRTVEWYYGGSTVVPVVVPVFWSLVPTRFLTNFLYELEVGPTPAEKPESGRVCGPNGSPKVLLGRLGGRGKVRPNAEKKLVFLVFVSSADLFLFLVVFLFFPLSSSPRKSSNRSWNAVMNFRERSLFTHSWPVIKSLE